ncbi:MAG: hypothetical protein QG597_4899, partial [Actinomycetota bacterium]|nr:hypothetical protein [Actinomycetota bacterium]
MSRGSKRRRGQGTAHGRAGETEGIGPAVVEPAREYVRIGDGYAVSFAVTGYPVTVGPAWLDPLL